MAPNPNDILIANISRNMEKKGPKDFFPTLKLQQVLVQKDIMATLQSVRMKLPAREQAVSELTAFVTNKAYPIFAGLVVMGKPWLITSFYNKDFGQNNLPIRYTFRQDNTLEFVLDGGDGAREIDAMFRDESPVWEEPDIERFCRHLQWQFTAPIFEKEKFRYEFAGGTVLPFTSSPEQLDSGGFGLVEKVTIHRDHIDHATLSPCQLRELTFWRFDKTTNPIVALKTLQNGTPEAVAEYANKEARNLEAVRALKSQHLIKAIAYYRLGSKHCFLFPLAEHKNLWYFWATRVEERKQGRRHRGDNKFLVWVFTQLVGIADAVVELHGDVPNIRHGDLKPENILCFQNGSCTQDTGDLPTPPIQLVITDVGISKGHQGPTQRRAVTSTVVSSGRYEPPEMERTGEATGHSKLSRRYDVWSLGCILLEFLIWLLYDFEGTWGLLEFTDTLKDRFYESDKEVTRIHPTVSQWIKKIKNDKTNCQEKTPFWDLVVLIEEKLLVVSVETLPGTLSEAAPTESHKTRQRFRNFLAGLRKTQQKTPVEHWRASAEDMRDELGNILEKIKQRKYEVKRVAT